MYIMQTIKLTDEFITLGQLLKQEGYISTGGQAKYYLHEEEVYVNNELEQRRGKKLYIGDVIKLPNDEIIELI